MSRTKRNLNPGDVIFLAPYCVGKFEVGELLECWDIDTVRCWMVKMWGVNRHPCGSSSKYKYGDIIKATRGNAWHHSRLESAYQIWNSQNCDYERWRKYESG